MLSEAGSVGLVRRLVVGASGVDSGGGTVQHVLQALEALVPTTLSIVVGFLCLAFPIRAQLVQRLLEVVEAVLQVIGTGCDVSGGGVKRGVVYLEIQVSLLIYLISHSPPSRLENEFSVSDSLASIDESVARRLSARS